MKWGTEDKQKKRPFDCSTERSDWKKAATYSPALHCSTIGASGLNFSVRNGKRWDTTAITTWYFFRFLLYLFLVLLYLDADLKLSLESFHFELLLFLMQFWFLFITYTKNTARRYRWPIATSINRSIHNLSLILTTHNTHTTESKSLSIKVSGN